MEAPETPNAPESAAPAVARTSLVARMTNVFAAPNEVFLEVKASPPATANWLAPALVAVLLGWLAAWLIFSQESVQHQLSELSEKSIQKQIEARKIPKEQADQMRAAAEKFGGIGIKVTAVVAPAFMAFASPFWWGLLIWLVGAKALRSHFSFMKAVEVAGLANMVLLLGGIAATFIVVWRGDIYAGPHLGMVLPDFDPTNPFHQVFSAIDVFVIWVLVVRSLGLARLAGVSFGNASAWLFSLWVFFKAAGIGVGYAMKTIFGG